jgi:hypothetical protein
VTALRTVSDKLTGYSVAARPQDEYDCSVIQSQELEEGTKRTTSETA